jgi:hypothetical protein
LLQAREVLLHQNNMKMRLAPGDIFEVKLLNRKRYFQFIFQDKGYLGGDLLRAFKYEIINNEILNLNQVITSEIDFFTYTWIKDGIKDGLWVKIGNAPIEIPFQYPTFRQTNEPRFGGPFKSNQWFIWNKDFENQEFIGELTEEFAKLPESSVLPPSAIVKWLDCGDHGFISPT